jgi:hypothetical protein
MTIARSETAVRKAAPCVDKPTIALPLGFFAHGFVFTRIDFYTIA